MGDQRKRLGEKPVRGTREWAVAAVDCCLGCDNGCLYCYGRYEQVYEKGLVTAVQWANPVILQEQLERDWPDFGGQVMFPCNHDITEKNLTAAVALIRKLLAAGNRVLVVSKPRLSCLTSLCEQLAGSREQLLFRFTITARDPQLLKIWEPGAPGYAERVASLRHAHDAGYATSVSIEPMLQPDDVVAMVAELLPWVSHSIWLGKMNKIATRVDLSDPRVKEAAEAIAAGQSDARLWRIYEQLKGESKIRWKDSIKEALGLQTADLPGLDR